MKAQILNPTVYLKIEDMTGETPKESWTVPSYEAEGKIMEIMKQNYCTSFHPIVLSVVLRKGGIFHYKTGKRIRKIRVQSVLSPTIQEPQAKEATKSGRRKKV